MQVLNGNMLNAQKFRGWYYGLHKEALYEVVKKLNEDNTIDMIYTDEDKEFLKHAVNNGELTIRDLTFEEAMLLGFSGKDYRRAARQSYSKVVFTIKELKQNK